MCVTYFEVYILPPSYTALRIDTTIHTPEYEVSRTYLVKAS